MTATLKEQLEQWRALHPMPPSEAVAIKRALEPEIKEAARERQAVAGQLKSEASGKLPQAEKGASRDKAAAFTGFGARTLDKAEAIVAAAEAELANEFPS
jgi:hypothetical protein